MDEVGDLVRDDKPACGGWGEDQPPAVADPPLGRAAAPARIGVADRDRARRCSRHGGDGGGFPGEGVESMTLEKRFDPARKRALRSAAAQLIGFEKGNPRLAWCPDQARLLAFDRDARSGSERFGRQHVGELRVDPRPLLGRPGERRASAGADWAGELEHSAAFVEPKPQPTGTAHRLDLHRHGQVGVDGKLLRARARRHEIQAAPPHRLR